MGETGSQIYKNPHNISYAFKYLKENLLVVGILWTIQLSRMLTIEKLDVGLDRFQIIGRIGLNDSANTFSPAQGYSGFFRIKLVALEFFFPFLLDN